MCRAILNGKMYVCPKAASLMELGLANDIERIDLLCADNLREEIKTFLCLMYSNACAYCDMASSEEKIIVAAEQVERGIQMEI